MRHSPVHSSVFVLPSLSPSLPLSLSSPLFQLRFLWPSKEFRLGAVAADCPSEFERREEQRAHFHANPVATLTYTKVPPSIYDVHIFRLLPPLSNKSILLSATLWYFSSPLPFWVDVISVWTPTALHPFPFVLKS